MNSRSAIFILLLLLSLSCENNSGSSHWAYGTWSIAKEKSRDSFESMDIDVGPEHKKWILNMIDTSDEELTINKDEVVLHYTDQEEQSYQYKLIESTENSFIIEVREHKLELGRDDKGVYRISPAVAKVRNKEGVYEEQEFELKLYMKK